LFDAVSKADPENFLTPVTLVISIATVLVSVIYGVIFFRQGIAGIGIGAASSSYFNSVNICLPVSIYVIGYATHVVPILLLQMMIYTAVILGMLVGGSFFGAFTTGLFSTDVLASFAGFFSFVCDVVSGLVSTDERAYVARFIVAEMGWEVPDPVAEPIALLGGADNPMDLMSLGSSISGAGVPSNVKSRPTVLTATTLKLVG